MSVPTTKSISSAARTLFWSPNCMGVNARLKMILRIKGSATIKGIFSFYLQVPHISIRNSNDDIEHSPHRTKNPSRRCPCWFTQSLIPAVRLHQYSIPAKWGNWDIKTDISDNYGRRDLVRLTKGCSEQALQILSGRDPSSSIASRYDSDLQVPYGSKAVCSLVRAHKKPRRALCVCADEGTWRYFTNHFSSQCSKRW